MVKPIRSCDVIVALGGDGKMLKTLKASVNVKRKCSLENIPVYGMNCGTVGFLMNTYHQDDLIDCINHAEQTILPLSMTTVLFTAMCIMPMALMKYRYHGKAIRPSNAAFLLMVSSGYLKWLVMDSLFQHQQDQQPIIYRHMAQLFPLDQMFWP